MKGRASLAGMLFACISALSSPANATEPGPILRAQQRENSFVVAPGSTRTLTISVVRTDGSPVPGVGVVFSAPEHGPGGLFPMSERPGSANAAARDRLEWLGRGGLHHGTGRRRLLGERTAGGRRLGGHFRVHQRRRRPAGRAGTPPRSRRRSKTRSAAKTRSSVSPRSSTGPCFCRPVRSSPLRRPRSPGARVEPFVVEQDSWLLWVDDFPFADFGHAARVLAIPSDAAADQIVARTETRSVRWWPTVRLPGETAGTLSSRRSARLSRPRRTPWLRSGRRVVSERLAPDDACAIMLHGPNMPQGAGHRELPPIPCCATTSSTATACCAR